MKALIRVPEGATHVAVEGPAAIEWFRLGDENPIDNVAELQHVGNGRFPPTEVRVEDDVDPDREAAADAAESKAEVRMKPIPVRTAADPLVHALFPPHDRLVEAEIMARHREATRLGHYMKFRGDSLKAWLSARRPNRHTQEQMAELFGYAGGSAIGRMFNGDCPAKPYLVRIANEVGVPMNRLVELRDVDTAEVND